MDVEIDTVDLTATPDVQTGACPIIKAVLKKTHIFDANMKKKLLSQYDLDSKIKSQEWLKLNANKKALMTIICGQCDNATLTKLALRTTYAVDCGNGNIIKFLDRSKTHML